MPIKLASTVLAIYVVLACGHMVFVTAGKRVYKGYSNVGDVVNLAWVSTSTDELKNTSAGAEKRRTWGQMVRVREVQVAAEQRLHLRLGDIEDNDERERGRPRPGILYA